jgi:hypothetical protein
VNSSALLALVKRWVLRENAIVKTYISPSRTLLSFVKYKDTIAPMNRTAASSIAIVAATRFIFCIKNSAIDSSTCESTKSIRRHGSSKSLTSQSLSNPGWRAMRSFLSSSRFALNPEKDRVWRPFCPSDSPSSQSFRASVVLL